MFYFAYASNMNKRQMAERCPGCKFLKRAYLENWKYFYDQHPESKVGAKANIFQSRGDVVWGALFEINGNHLESMDHHEGYPKQYQREIVTIRDDDGQSYEAWVYFRKPQTPGRPSPEYLEIVRQGALDSGLPEDYLKNVMEKF
jgi:gamma-glutamylcyclotransferase